MEASDLKKFSKEKVPSEKSFGLTIAIGVAIYSLVLRREINFAFLAVCVVLVAISLVNPKIFKLPNKLWIKLGELLGKILTPVVMGGIFFLFITPFGFLLRMLNKLQFQYRFDQNHESYWIERKDADFTADKFNRQF